MRSVHRAVWVLLAVAVCWPSAGPAVASAQDRLVSVGQIQAALERGDTAGAKAAVEAALRVQPEDPALNNFAGVIAAQNGDWEAAERHFRAAIRLAPRAVPPYENLGRLYQERAAVDPEAPPKALDVYRALLAIDPANVEAVFQSAQLRVRAGEFAASSELLDQLPQHVQGRPQALAVRVAALAGSGNGDAAAVVDTLAAHPDLALEDVLAVLPAFEHLQSDEILGRLLSALDRRGIMTPDLLRRLAAIHMQRGQFADAREKLERVVAAGQPTVPVLLDLARAAEKTGDHTGALGYLAHARSLEPDNAAVHFLFGLVYVQLELGAEAYESLKKAVSLEPDNAPVNYMMGAVSLHRHDPSEAVPYFEKYVSLEPNDPRGRFALGLARFHGKDFDGAQRDLAGVAELRETAPGANYFLARIARQSGRLGDARRHVDRAIQANPAYADAWAELGLLQTRAGQYAQAEQSLQKALSLDAENYHATVNLAIRGSLNRPHASMRCRRSAASGRRTSCGLSSSCRRRPDAARMLTAQVVCGCSRLLD
jgi:tetratricopeptide (TPR) repeat protein